MDHQGVVFEVVEEAAAGGGGSLWIWEVYGVFIFLSLASFFSLLSLTYLTYTLASSFPRCSLGLILEVLYTHTNRVKMTTTESPRPKQLSGSAPTRRSRGTCSGRSSPTVSARARRRLRFSFKCKKTLSNPPFLFFFFSSSFLFPKHRPSNPFVK